MRRIRKAAGLYLGQLARTGVAPAVICNGGGTTHKPKWVDAAGYSVPEAALMGRELIGLGVKSDDIFLEGYSDDTIGAQELVELIRIRRHRGKDSPLMPLRRQLTALSHARWQATHSSCAPCM